MLNFKALAMSMKEIKVTLVPFLGGFKKKSFEFDVSFMQTVLPQITKNLDNDSISSSFSAVEGNYLFFFIFFFIVDQKKIK